MEKWWLSATNYEPAQTVRSLLVNATVQSIRDIGWYAQHVSLLASIQSRQVSDFKNKGALHFTNFEKILQTLPDKGQLRFCLHVVSNYGLWNGLLEAIKRFKGASPKRCSPPSESTLNNESIPSTGLIRLWLYNVFNITQEQEDHHIGGIDIQSRAIKVNEQWFAIPDDCYVKANANPDNCYFSEHWLTAIRSDSDKCTKSAVIGATIQAFRDLGMRQMDVQAACGFIRAGLLTKFKQSGAVHFQTWEKIIDCLSDAGKINFVVHLLLNLNLLSAFETLSAELHRLKPMKITFAYDTVSQSCSPKEEVVYDAALLRYWLYLHFGIVQDSEDRVTELDQGVIWIDGVSFQTPNCFYSYRLRPIFKAA